MFRTSKILSSLFLIGTLSISPTFAEPKVGDIIARSDSVMCDTRQQIVDIVQAGRFEFQPSFDKFMEYNTTTNDLNQPVCAADAWLNLPVLTVESSGVIRYPDGPVNTWIVEIDNEEGAPSHPSYWILWTEKISGHEI